MRLIRGVTLFLLAVGVGAWAVYVALTRPELAGTLIATDVRPLPLATLFEEELPPEAVLPSGPSVDSTPQPEEAKEIVDQAVVATAPHIPEVVSGEGSTNPALNPEKIAPETQSANSIKLIDLPPSEAIRGKECRLGLKEIGFRSLSLRDGSLDHGDRVSWKRDYSKNKRISILYASQDPVVEVLGIGFDESGRQRVAFVQEKSSGKRGVISLFVEDKRVALTPVI